MHKIKIGDSLKDIIYKISEGNPGVIAFILELSNLCDKKAINFVKLLMIIDSMELYGSSLYMLWNDSCGRDINKSIKIIQAFRVGIITKQHIKERILNVGYGKSFDDLVKSFTINEFI